MVDVSLSLSSDGLGLPAYPGCFIGRNKYSRSAYLKTCYYLENRVPFIWSHTQINLGNSSSCYCT